MLKLDRSLAAVEVVEADVDVLYQSVNQLDIALEGYESQLCEAVVCGLNPGEKGRVYAAINLMKERRTLVYTGGNLGSDRGRYDEAMQEALDFLEPLGFQLKEVNLNYSAAMKQVILKGITGIKLPGSGKPEWKERLEKVVATQEEQAGAKAKESAKKALKPQVSVPEAPEEKPASTVPSAPAARKSEGSDVTAMLRLEVARLQEKVDELEGGAAPLRSRIKELEQQLSREREQASELADEREKDKSEWEKSAAAATRTIAALKKERDGLQENLASEREHAEGELAEFKEQLERLQTENRELAKKSGEELKHLSERLKRAEADLEESKKEQEAIACLLREQEKEREEEMVRLVAEAAEAEVRGEEQLRRERGATHERLMALRLLLGRLWTLEEGEALPAGEEFLSLLMGEVSRAPSAFLDAREGARETTMHPEAPVSRKAGKARPVARQVPEEQLPGGEEVTPTASCEEPAVAAVEEVPCTVEAEAEVPVARELPEPLLAEEGTGVAALVPGEEVAASGIDVRGRVAELFYPEPTVPEAKALQVEPEAELPEAAEEVSRQSTPREEVSLPPDTSPPPAWVTSSVAVSPAGALSDFDLSGGSGGQAATLFLLDDSQSDIAVDADNLLEIHRSANVQRVAPAGGAPEEGNAYVCAFREGKRERVVAILEMVKGRQRFVYLPQDPSLDRNTLVRSALTFVEDIGFFMLAESLPETAEERKTALQDWALFVRWHR